MKFPILRAPLVGVKFGGGTSARILAAIGSMQPAGIWFPGKGLPAPTQSPTLSTIGKKPVHGEDDEQPELTVSRSEEHTSELQSRFDLVCRLLLEKKKMKV